MVAFNDANHAFADHGHFTVVPRDDSRRLRDVILDFQPDIIHAHWLFLTEPAFEASRIAGVPFTIRAHSFDVLAKDQTLPRSAALVRADACAGVLVLPFARRILEREGFPADRLHVCYPVLDFARFFDASPNGDAVMNVGVWKPKKDIVSFVDLARRARGRMTFDLYAPGIDTAPADVHQRLRDASVVVHAPIEPARMPAEYKKHRWLVCTASAAHNTVGWPVILAEAQASGVGVCMQNIRPDLAEYVGDAGYLFDSIGDACDIVSRPFPEPRRQLGFAQARKSDIRTHIGVLERLWGWTTDDVHQRSRREVARL